MTLEATKSKKVPRLRFPGFSGEWEEKTLGDVSDVKGGKRIPKGFSLLTQDNGHPYVTVSGMVNGGIDMKEVKFVPEPVINSINNYTISSEDIYVSVAGTLGLVGAVPKILDGANLTENADKLTNLKVNRNYLLQLLRSDRFKKLVRNVKTDNAQPKLAIYALKGFALSLPRTEEQEKIASFLGVMDDKIAAIQSKSELLEKYKKGIMQAIFSQKIRFKDEEERNYPDWQEKTLGDFASFLKGKGISKEDITESGAIKCIRYGELYTGYTEVIKSIKSKTNLDPSGLVFSKLNDVIIPASGETSIDIATASCVLQDGVALSGDINIIRTKQNGVYLAYYLTSAKNLDIVRLAQGNSVVHLYPSQLKDLDIKIPSTEEQQKIADFLTSIDEKINLAEDELEQAKKFKEALLQQMFV